MESLQVLVAYIGPDGRVICENFDSSFPDLREGEELCNGLLHKYFRARTGRIQKQGFDGTVSTLSPVHLSLLEQQHLLFAFQTKDQPHPLHPVC